MRTKTLLLIITLFALFTTAYYYDYYTNPQSVQFKVLPTFASTPKYTGNVAVERLAKHITSNEKEQKAISEFIQNFEDVFHFKPETLFNKTDYLTVAVVTKKDQVESVEFTFSHNEPTVNMFNKWEEAGTVYWNGKIRYRVIFFNSKAYYHGFYEGPSKKSNWSSAKGYGDDANCWYKIINLRKFDWYQPSQP